MSIQPSPHRGISILRKSLKILSVVVLAIIAVVIVYVLVIAMKNWSSIGV